MMLAFVMILIVMPQIRKYSEIKSHDMKESGGILEEIFYSVKTVY